MTAAMRLVLHRLDGVLSTSMATPFIRVHVVEAATGVWRQKVPGRQVVYNLDRTGRPFLRAAQGRTEPWQADGVQSSYILPFATLPRALRRSRSSASWRSLPSWEEAFLLEPLPAQTALLFEVLDVVAERSAEGEDPPSHHYVPVAWGFLLVDAVATSTRPRRLRVQLYKYRNYRYSGRSGRSQDASFAESQFQEGGRAAVCDEYCDAGRGHGAQRGSLRLVSMLQYLLGRGKRHQWPAALEISLSSAEQTGDLGKALEALHMELTARAQAGGPVRTASGDGISGSGAAGLFAEAGQDSLESGDEMQSSKLAPHHLRPRDQPCAPPESLLWQIASGKRGASRISFSPSGRFLAAAVARPGGATELRVFHVASGRLHASCAATHDAMVYDLCWHSFSARSAPVGARSSNHPLLISCGGDSVVQVYEVPDELPNGPSQALLLRPHARLQLPSHVYSVRPHLTTSSDPRRLVLMCGGHRFGLMICEVSRVWQAAGDGGKWLVTLPHLLEPVSYELSHLRQSGGTVYLQSHDKDQKHLGDPTMDVLCVRFSNQLSQADSLYASTASGHLMLFQLRYNAEAGRGGLHAGLVRSYAAPELHNTPIYSMEVVTQQMVQGKRLNQVQLSMVDDWVILFARDHAVRLASLQRGFLRIEMEMTGLECGSYPVRGCMSPDAQYIACGSETGELLVWDAAGARADVPQVRLAGPVMDVAWSDTHHLVACCSVDDQEPPILLLAGRSPDPAAGASPRTGLSPRREVSSPLRDSPRQLTPLRHRDREELNFVPSSIAPTAALTAHKWATQWLSADANFRSALTIQEKQNIKKQILSQLLDKKSAAELEEHFAARRPGL